MASSTKIQEYDLDPQVLSGVAQEATSQDILIKVIGLISSGGTLTCMASSNVIFTLIKSEVVGAGTVARLKVNKTSGSLRITASCHSTTSQSVSIKVSTTNNVSKTLSFGEGKYVTKSEDFNIVDGDIITINAEGGMFGGEPCINLLTIGGDFSEPTNPVPGISIL